MAKKKVIIEGDEKSVDKVLRENRIRFERGELTFKVSGEKKSKKDE